MMTRNLRRAIPVESYDPKQRLVGGIVLFILMMLLYYLLKAVLGISTTGADYALSEALPDEIGRQQLGEIILNADHDVVEGKADATAQQRFKQITGFEFLGLDGHPIDGKVEPASTPLDDWDLADGSRKWRVQAASFREKGRADTFVEQLAGIRLKARIVHSGNYYIVHLEPQKTREEAKQQLYLLRSKLRVKGIIRER